MGVRLGVSEGGEIAGQPVRFSTEVNWGSRRRGRVGLSESRVVIYENPPAQLIWSKDQQRRFDAALGRLLVAASKVPGLLVAGWSARDIGASHDNEM